MDSRIWREFNYFLIFCVLALLGISIVSVYSATLSAMTAYGTFMNVLFPRHIGNILIGLIVMVAMMFLDYRLLSGLARPIYLGIMITLAIVLVVGNITEGAQSWIAIGTRTFQPSEFAKLLSIVVLAAYWSHFAERSEQWMVQLGGLALAAMPLLLVLMQPDFGTAMVFGFIWLAMAWDAGIRWQQLAVVVLVAIPVVFVGWEHVLNEEQRSRLLIFYWMLTDPSQANPDEAYNIVQSLNAIRSGGWFGAGLTDGLLSQGNYIPVQYSDFIFAVISEEMGFVGGIVLLTFQAILLWVTLSIAGQARDKFGRLIAVGIFGMLLSHVLINVGMAMSMMPVTGIPLPLISYGGSFTIMILASIGLLESIAMRWRKISF